MATATTQPVTSKGVTPTVLNASGGGDKVRPGSIVRVTNGGGSPITLTMATPGVFDTDLAISDREITIANGTSKYVKASTPYRNSSDGLVWLTWSGVTSVTFEVVA